MNDANGETPAQRSKFDFPALPEDSLIHDRRTGHDRRAEGPAPARPPAPAAERRARKERRRRIDPTTFEKQYTEDELEFMNAMQRFKDHTGKSFPSYGEVLQVARSLGYRKPSEAREPGSNGAGPLSNAILLPDAP